MGALTLHPFFASRLSLTSRRISSVFASDFRSGDIELVEECRSFSVRRLISECFESRLELSEDDEAWIIELKSEGSPRIRRRHIGRLLRCAREVGAVHVDEA